MVLGMDWIDMIAPMAINTKPHSVSFMKGSRMVTLVGYPDSQSMAKMDSRLVYGMLNRAGCNWVAQTCYLESVEPNEELVPALVKDILSKFTDVFNEPTALPPARSCDNAIELVPGARPIN